ncbi:MAG: GAF domain-containing protein [Gammaproteobacteria bacterium]|nr:GAF domain-containing protein [Gammaproteobacteria bacterium]
MIPPPKPYNERQRLETLRALNILDTDPEERFDRFTRLAAKLFDVPIALVSLVDANRQWFKSKQGLSVCETSREISFCGHAILGDDVLVIEDATLDERFADNPLVTNDPSIRFYAGYPLTAPDGNNVGTLCIIDRQPRHVSPEELRLLRELGRSIEQEMVALNRATVDEATSLTNLNGFEAMAGYALALCRRMSRPATFLYLNLSSAGATVAGDGPGGLKSVLYEFAQMLLVAFRDSDVIGRIGQHEFGIVLTGAGVEEAEQPIRRIEELVRDYNLRDGQTRTLDFDVATILYDPETHHSIADMIGMAEQKVLIERHPVQEEAAREKAG